MAGFNFGKLNEAMSKNLKRVDVLATDTEKLENITSAHGRKMVNTIDKNIARIGNSNPEALKTQKAAQTGVYQSAGFGIYGGKPSRIPGEFN